jgi:archaeosine-15-forming tRNA-guanine transglycosylase
MVSFLHEHTRIGVDGNHAVVNSTLPLVAAHNLVFGGEMMLASTPGMAVTTTGPPTKAGPKTIEEVLESRMSISFDQDSLEFSMRNVVDEVRSSYQLSFEFGIKIMGDDLKLDGITRNGQIRDFAQENKTVAEVLTAMVMKANPVTTVKVPNEKDQKLLWVIAPDPDNPSNRIVLITTRQIADLKYTLPEVFRLP